MLELIDWRLVGFGGLWVFGLGVALAALSFADYEAARARVRTREVLRRPGYQAAIYLGLALFAAGQGALAAGWLLQAAWLLVAAGLGWAAWGARRK